MQGQEIPEEELAKAQEQAQAIEKMKIFHN